MTTVAVQEFLNKVSEDESLQAELAKALEAENDRQAVTDLADSKGYDFTPEELWAEVQKRQAEALEKQEAGELSDEELEAVAGGEVAVSVLATIVSVSASAALVTAGGAVGVSISQAKW